MARYELSQVIELGTENDCGVVHTYVVFLDNDGHIDIACSCTDKAYETFVPAKRI